MTLAALALASRWTSSRLVFLVSVLTCSIVSSGEGSRLGFFLILLLLLTFLLVSMLELEEEEGCLVDWPSCEDDLALFAAAAETLRFFSAAVRVMVVLQDLADDWQCSEMVMVGRERSRGGPVAHQAHHQLIMRRAPPLALASLPRLKCRTVRGVARGRPGKSSSLEVMKR